MITLLICLLLSSITVSEIFTNITVLISYSSSSSLLSIRLVLPLAVLFNIKKYIQIYT